MFDIRPMPAPIAPDLLAQLHHLDPPTVGHFRETGFMAPTIRALMPDLRVAGPAVTVLAPGGDGLMITHALGLVRPGDVLVIDRCGDDRHAAWGGILAAAAAAAGLAGVVIDGAICDPAAIRASGVPVWYRGTSALTTKRLGQGGGINLPVSCGGVMVRAGDAVIADDSGVLVLPVDDIAEVAPRALARQTREADLLARIAAGERTTDIFGTQALIDAARAQYARG